MSQADQPKIRGLARILPYLYLGGAVAAHEKEELERLQITKIINCCSEEVENGYPEDFKYTNVPLTDGHKCDISEYFESVFDVIKTCKDEKTRCLIHCQDGKGLSASMVLAYMMMASHRGNKYLPLQKAMDHVNSKMVGIKPNEGFLGRLIKLEKSLFDSASVSMGPSSRGKSKGHRRGKGRRGK
jgi:hypothetical protein